MCFFGSFYVYLWKMYWLLQGISNWSKWRDVSICHSHPLRAPAQDTFVFVWYLPIPREIVTLPIVVIFGYISVSMTCPCCNTEWYHATFTFYDFKLQARYYGGDVVLKSMEGFGTDVYVFLNRRKTGKKTKTSLIDLSTIFRFHPAGKTCSNL